MLGTCRTCGARYRRSGSVNWIEDPDYESDDSS
jgi:hypothetical protein